MQQWFGSSGVCINEHGQLLMVLQGKPEEKKRGLFHRVERNTMRLTKSVVFEKLSKKRDI